MACFSVRWVNLAPTSIGAGAALKVPCSPIRRLKKGLMVVCCPPAQMPEFSRKNCLLSGKKILNRSRLLTARSKSACAKSVLKVRSNTDRGLIAHLTSPPNLKSFISNRSPFSTLFHIDKERKAQYEYLRTGVALSPLSILLRRSFDMG